KMPLDAVQILRPPGRTCEFVVVFSLVRLEAQGGVKPLRRFAILAGTKQRVAGLNFALNDSRLVGRIQGTLRHGTSKIRRITPAGSATTATSVNTACLHY